MEVLSSFASIECLNRNILLVFALYSSIDKLCAKSIESSKADYDVSKCTPVAVEIK